MVGLITSEGDRAIQSDIARQLFGLTGAGIKIGVISDSFGVEAVSGPTVAETVARGDLPGAGNPNGFTQPVRVLAEPGFGLDIGRGLSEIIHDVAPGAELLFHAIETSFTNLTNQDVTNAGLAKAIRTLAAAGADVILFDPGESVPATLFQDNVAVQAIDEVAKQGVIVVAPAGDTGPRSYESELRLSDTFSYRGNTYQAHDFEAGDGKDLFQEIKLRGGDEINLLFNWQQAAGQVASDFELLLLDRPELPGAGGQILARGGIVTENNLSDNTNDPSRSLYYSASAGDQTVYLLIAKKQNAATPDPDRIKWINIQSYNPLSAADQNIVYEYVNDRPQAQSPATVYGAANAAGALTVGAANYAQTPAYGVAAIPVEDYSSSGGSPIFFDPQGNPLPEPEVRNKPDVIAPTRVSANTPVYDQFPTTATAAAHVAGTVALMLERAGGSKSLSLEQVRARLQETALPVESQANLPEGAGFIQANHAVTQSYTVQQEGSPNHDVIQGGDASENLLGAAGSDQISGGDGLDALFGGEGHDTLMGEQGNDYLLGEQGDDRLAGGAGNDFLDGGSGTDRLSGGDGADRFLLNPDGTALIGDFQADDRLVLPTGKQFSDLEVVQQGDSAVIKLADREVARLSVTEASSITADDFIAFLPAQRQPDPPQNQTPAPNNGSSPENSSGTGSNPESGTTPETPRPVTSEGDRAMRTDVARKLFSLDGSGIKIGIISDSFDYAIVDDSGTTLSRASDEIKNGELPGEGNPNGYTQSVQVLKDTAGYNEGRALAQIIHDIAPGAQLLFHTIFNDGVTQDQSFASTVEALVAAGADIIVDDIGSTSSQFFQDGAKAKAVDEAAKQGVVYVSASGNLANLSYESEFRSGEVLSYRGNRYQIHDFDASAGVDLFQEIKLTEYNQLDLLFNWQQAAGRVQTDFELFLLDKPLLPGAGSKILSTAYLDTPANTDNPAQSLFYTPLEKGGETVYLMIARKEGSTLPESEQIKWISFNRDASNTYEYVNDRPDATGGSTVFGQANAAGAIAVGAANFKNTPAYGVSPVPVEDYSSSGGSPILFDSQGNPLPEAERRNKPDVIGPSSVTTTVPFFEQFPGTSAAAPHVAGAIALMLQRAGGSKSLTPEQVRTALQETVIPVAPRPNLPEDTGFIQGDAAVIQSSTAQQEGTEGHDVIQGGNAAENLFGLTGNDQLSGGDGFDALFGGDGEDTLDGGLGNDYLLGELGNDRIAGADGNDFLTGGRGTNELTGGSGADQFLLDAGGTATIWDFKRGEDLILLPTGNQFRDLEVVQQGWDSVVKLSGNQIALLSGIQATTITPADFADALPRGEIA